MLYPDVRVRGDDLACAWAKFSIWYISEAFGPVILSCSPSGILLWLWLEIHHWNSNMPMVEFQLLTKFFFFFLHQRFQENPFSWEQFTSILLSHNLPLHNPNVKVHPLYCVERVCPDDITDIQAQKFIGWWS